MSGQSDKVVKLTLSPDFARFVEQVHQQHKIVLDTVNYSILALDPGETTGVAEFDAYQRTITVYQKETKEIGPSYKWLYSHLYDGPGGLDEYGESDTEWDHIRCEDYRIYEWKTQDHAWSQVHTVQWIGAIKVAAYNTALPLSFCLAQHAKGFWTDEKLKHFGLYPTGLRHGKDALRHLLYYMCFPNKA